MRRIRSDFNVNHNLLPKSNVDRVKEFIKKEIIYSVADEMFKLNCFDIKSELQYEQNIHIPESTKYSVQTFILTADEIRDAINSLETIKSGVSPIYMYHIDKIYSILTKEPQP